MPRGTNERGSGRRDDGGDEPVATKPPTPGPGMSSWLEEAWHGWMKSVGGIVLLVGAYFLYEYKVIPESPAGRLLMMAIIAGSIFAGIEPVRTRVASTRDKALLGLLVAVWAVAAAGPVFRTVVPSKELATAQISADKNQTTTEVKLDGESGPYEIVVGGNLKGSGEAEANYSFDVKGDAGGEDHVEGVIKRTFFRQRVSRRSSGAVAVRQENAQNVHRLPGVRGSKVTISAEIAGELEPASLSVSFHRARLNPLLFAGLGLLVLLAAFVVDYKLIAPKMEKTYLAVWAGFTLAFSAYYPFEATPDNLVRPAVAAVLFALGVGMLPAWFIGFIANSFKPRPKKLAGVKS